MVGQGPGAGQSGVARRAREAAWRPCGAGRQEGRERARVPCDLVGEQRWAGPRRSEELVKAGARCLPPPLVQIPMSSNALDEPIPAMQPQDNDLEPTQEPGLSVLIDHHVAERQQACQSGHYVVFRDNSQQNSRVGSLRCCRMGSNHRRSGSAEASDTFEAKHITLPDSASTS